MVEGMWKLTALDQACPHPHPGASIGHGLATRHASWAKENLALLATPWHPHPSHPHPTVGLCCPRSQEEGRLLVQRVISGLRAHGSDQFQCPTFLGSNWPGEMYLIYTDNTPKTLSGKAPSTGATDLQSFFMSEAQPLARPWSLEGKM